MREEDQYGADTADHGERCVECGTKTSAPHAWGGQLCDHCARETQE